jgi:hypothetical protein
VDRAGYDVDFALPAAAAPTPMAVGVSMATQAVKNRFV